MGYSENFNKRFITSIPLLLVCSLCLYFGINYINILICVVFLLIFFEWNYFFLKKINISILIQLLLLLLLELSYFIELSLFYLLLVLNIIYIIVTNYKYKFKYIYSFTLFYFILSMLSLLSLNNKINTYNLILLIFISIVCFDSFSYLFGKLIQGKKLIPRISPGKTISGLVFGFTLSFSINSGN